MNLCKTCVFWKFSAEDEYEPGDQVARPRHPVTFEPQSEEQTNTDHGYVVRYCKHPKILFYERPEIDGAAVVDGSEYHAALLTAEAFGCVLHEERVI